MQRLADGEHDVVGDVDGQRDRAHPRLLESALHPQRGPGGGVDPAHHSCDVPVAPALPADRCGIVEDDGEAVLVGLGDVEVGRVGERRAGAVGVLAGHSADAQRVAAVRGDVDLDGLGVQTEQRDGVGADGYVPQTQLGQPDDPGVVVTQAELRGRANHALGDVSVGRAGRDREPTGQQGTGTDHDDRVSGLEVVRPADDAHRTALPVVADVPHIDAAPPYRLAVPLRLVDELEHPPDHQWSAHPAAVDGLLLQADCHQVGGHLPTGHALGQRDVLAQPGQRNPHQMSIP